MKMMKKVLLVGCLSLISATAWSNSSQHVQTPYAGYQGRDIKSLSNKDIEDIQQGRGWGLALPAELNGLPGPIHLLELKDKLDLTPEQIVRIQEIYDDMKQEAITVGERFIQAERMLDEAFKEKDIVQSQLTSLILNSAFRPFSEHSLSPIVMATR